jgi:hypothetical protein
VFVPGISGLGRFAVAEGSSTVLVDGTGAETPLAGQGVLSVTDIDGDGNLDLAASWKEGGVVTVHRSTGEALGPPEQWASEVAIEGTVSGANGDTEVGLDLWFLDTAGALSHTLPPDLRGGPPVSAPTEP